MQLDHLFQKYGSRFRGVAAVGEGQLEDALVDGEVHVVARVEGGGEAVFEVGGELAAAEGGFVFDVVDAVDEGSSAVIF
jgi:hypothetical protein